MARRKKGRPSDTLGRFVMLSKDLIGSPVWRHLPVAATKVLFRLIMEHIERRGEGNGDLCVTYDQFVAYGVRRQSIALALRQLTRLGLIEVVRHGYRTSGGTDVPSLYRLTFVFNADHLESGKPTDEWRQLATVEAVQAALEAAATDRTPGSAKAGRGKARKVQDAGCDNAPSSGCENAPGKLNRTGCESAPSALGADSHLPSKFTGRGPHSDDMPDSSLEPAA